MPITESEAYAAIGENYRYFLSWRQRLFAGYFALLAALAIGLSWVVSHLPAAAWVMFASGAVISGLFWILERRNRDIYRHCYRSGAECEVGLAKGIGIYTRFLHAPRSGITHSRAMDLFYALMILTMTGAALLVGMGWVHFECPA